MKSRYDTYCGLYCGACPVLLANENDEVEKKAREWGMKPEELRCWGCKSGYTGVYCADCELKQCAEAKNIEFCFRCDHYPCERLVVFQNDTHPHHSIVLENLGRICQNSLSDWLVEQEKRWSCPGCSTRFSWYDKTCKNCGNKLYDCETEEKDLLECGK